LKSNNFDQVTMLFKGGFWLCFLLLHLGVQSREILKAGLTNEALDGLNEVQVDLRENGEEITPEEPENEMESEPEGSTETWMNQMKLWLEEKVKEVVENELKEEKAKKVYFSAYLDKGGPGRHVEGKLNFPKVMVNIGDAFDGPRGTFKAPIKGVYTFSFSGQQGISMESGKSIDLLVKRNGQTVFKILDDANTSGQDQLMQNINSIFSLELDENDTVSLELLTGDRLYATRNARLTFMGQLITAA